ncbi:MAG: coproporphyrinogen III oxidase family protein [Bacteroidales bacterium]|nr:coproporphyrinogen III oxidase family protein [Bacteroidales bacterium]
MIYVHVPFCKSRCIYCDFYSCALSSLDSSVLSRWADGVCREAMERRDEITATSAVDTLYFGGGTPSVLPPGVLGRIADACGGRSWKEWTVEVNPDDITPEYARALKSLGVNRVSMGVQSLDNGMLHWMNRRHDADGAREAFRRLRAAGFDNISIDIIFGIGGLSNAMLEATLTELTDWHPEHISAYQLSIEEGSTLGKMARGGCYTELSDELCEAQYCLICNVLRSAGYEHYEISNWALPGYRAIHNSAYWTRAPYVGLGPAAHSLRYEPQRITTIPRSCAAAPKGTGGVPPDTPCVAPLRYEPQRITTIGPLRTAPSWSEATEGIAASAAEGEPSPSPLGVQGDDSPLRTAPAVRSWNSCQPDGWTAESEVLSEEEIREERIMLGLRTAEGIPGYGRIPEERWFVADDIIASLL